jgi:hypothetical protein
MNLSLLPIYTGPVLGFVVGFFVTLAKSPPFILQDCFYAALLGFLLVTAYNLFLMSVRDTYQEEKEKQQEDLKEEEAQEDLKRSEDLKRPEPSEPFESLRDFEALFKERAYDHRHYTKKSTSIAMRTRSKLRSSSQ